MVIAWIFLLYIKCCLRVCKLERRPRPRTIFSWSCWYQHANKGYFKTVCTQTKMCLAFVTFSCQEIFLQIMIGLFLKFSIGKRCYLPISFIKRVIINSIFNIQGKSLISKLHFVKLLYNLSKFISLSIMT